MKTIVFIIDQVYMHGGIERVLSIKANYLATLKDYTVHIITTEQKRNTPCYEFNSNIYFQDIAINYNRLKSYFHPVNLIKLPKHILKLKSAFKKIKPDIVVVCSHSTDTYFMPFISKSIPKVKEYHYSKFIEEPLRKSTKTTFKKRFLQFSDYVNSKYDKIVTLNKTEASYYDTNNIVIIPNPLTFYPKTTAKLESKIVIAAGRIAHVKGYDQLLDIWEIVNKSKPDWQLHIYGDGDQEYIDILENRIKNKNLRKVAFLKGATQNVEKQLLKSSIFAMTSHNECFPLVLLEAQACGLPIVSFDCPYGPRNIIDKSNGVLVNMYDIESFSKELLSLMEDSNRLKDMGINARKNALKYKVEDVMEKWQVMLESLIK